jgi:hypothetical protein
MWGFWYVAFLTPNEGICPRSSSRPKVHRLWGNQVGQPDLELSRPPSNYHRGKDWTPPTEEVTPILRNRDRPHRLTQPLQHEHGWESARRHSQATYTI